MGRLEGKVAFITGAARGQGRSHAIRLAAGGRRHHRDRRLRGRVADAPYAGATEEDLAETVRQVEALDRRIVAAQGRRARLRRAARRGRRRRRRSSVGSTSSARTRASRRPWRRRRRSTRRSGGHDRRQPHRSLAHVQGGDPAPEGRRRADRSSSRARSRVSSRYRNIAHYVVREARGRRASCARSRSSSRPT